MPSGGAVQRVPGVRRSPPRRNALDPCVAVGTYFAAVRVGIGRVAGKTSAAVDSSTRSARWAQALRGSATPRIARDFLGPKPDWSLNPDSSQGMRRVR